MDKRGFWILSVFVVALLGWTYYLQEPPSAQPDPAAPAPELESSAPAASPAAAPASELPDWPARSVSVDTPLYQAVFNERGGRLESFRLKAYSRRKLGPEMPDELMELVTQPNRDDWSLRLSLTDADAPKLENAPFLADRASLTVPEGGTGQLTMTYTDPGGLKVARTLTFNADSYLVAQEVTLENGADLPFDGFVTMRLNSAPFAARPGRYDEMGAYLNDSLVTGPAEDAGESLGKYRGKLTRADWIGYMDQYFLTALVMPDPADEPELPPPSLSAFYQDHGGLAVGVSRPLNLGPGKKGVYNFDFYYGPKSNDDLRQAGHNLLKSVDLGWFSFLAAPLAALLRIIYSWTGNYGAAIILVTILIKVLLWPLTAKSYKSMKKMQNLGPKVTRLREKYADDKEAMNREIMQLYKTYKINPLGGCLPMLLQIPFFIAFYRVLDSLLELRGAPFMFWIQDLAAPDRLFSFNFSIPFFEPPTGIPVLTLLMGASMLLQQKMMPNTMGDPIQAKMMMLMPVIFTFILINMPAGLVLYWLVNNLLSIGQQTMINRPAKA
ncbi:MAG: membrane protein insertase YidC [Candidatus Adiutrix sp.]|jgi:YidC/Oxa1 family membrane protein insertase|nr:membrane protein insertase YidC [Candidatus Adiutrix sp.]